MPAGRSLADRHENTRHNREMKPHLELIPETDVGKNIFGPLVGLA